MRIHKVEQGEHFASIANKYGFHDWRFIYDHPDNAELRAKRPNPDVLFQGDRIAIPEKRNKNAPAPSEQRHRFKRIGTQVLLRIVVKDPTEEALVNARYELRLGDPIPPSVHEGRTSADGLLEEQIPVDATQGELTVWPDDESIANEYRWPLRIGHLNPVSEATGIQGRLKNLGLYDGKIDGDLGDKSQAALARFEEKLGPKKAGNEEDDTAKKLLSTHGA